MATTPVFLPGKFHGQKNLEGYSPQRVGHDLATEQQKYFILYRYHIFIHSFAKGRLGCFHAWLL